MRLGYTWLRRSARICPKQLMVGLGLFALPMSICSDGFADGVAILPQQPQLNLPTVTPSGGPDPRADGADPRVVRLQKFFTKLHCPVKEFAGDFVKAADENNLDWRLLPSISVVESGGGKACRNNNIFGWNQGTHAFSSIRSCIQEVADKLGNSPLYRRHVDAVSKLRIYNRKDGYAASVVALMERISPAPNFYQPRILIQPN
jgi:hypothetical protein